VAGKAVTPAAATAEKTSQLETRKMKFAKITLSVSALAIAAMTCINSAQAANDPTYNPATAVTVSGTITSVHEVPAGQPLEGVHVIVKNKANSFEVYIAPKEFLKFLHTSFVVGDYIDAMGSRVKEGAEDVILAREVSDGRSSIELRNVYGAEAWKNWGVEADPSAVR
jgi:hypothetical protein